MTGGAILTWFSHRGGYPLIAGSPFRWALMIGVLLFATAGSARGEELLVFISAFAPGEKGAIHAFQLDPAEGELKPLHRTAGIENPFFIAISPNEKYLYATQAPKQHGAGDEAVFAYALEGRTGKLNFLNQQPSLGTATCYVDVDATGKSVLLANYLSGSVAALPVNENGSLRPAASFLQHAGSSVDPQRQKGPHAHSIVTSPNNEFVLAADLGLDQLLSYRLDPATAQLTPARQPFARTAPGAGPRHLTFHPSGKHLYVINELSDTVTMYDYDIDSGLMIERQTVSTLPAEAEGDMNWTADLKITPDGKFLYGTNRGHDSLASYKIGDDGRLTRLAVVPSGGKNPQNLAITPGGELLLCANMGGGQVTVFRIDGATGGLTRVGEPIHMPNPSCIMVR